MRAKIAIFSGDEPKKRLDLDTYRVCARHESAHVREEPLEHEVAAVQRTGRRRGAPLRHGRRHALGGQPRTAAKDEHEHPSHVCEHEEQNGGPPPAPDQHAGQASCGLRAGFRAAH
jgi:hypothetical protein